MTLCPICRAFPRFALRVEAFKKQLDPTEGEKLFSAACWVIAALERTRPCSAHRRTLRRARCAATELAAFVQDGTLAGRG